jgi:hypothetical protein
MSSQSHSILQHDSGAKTLFDVSLIPLTFNSNQVLGQAEEAGTTSSISAQLEEVLVTAQKREQNVQDVPVTINAISARALDDFSILDFEDVQSLAPGDGPISANSNWRRGSMIAPQTVGLTARYKWLIAVQIARISRPVPEHRPFEF